MNSNLRRSDRDILASYRVRHFFAPEKDALAVEPDVEPLGSFGQRALVIGCDPRSQRFEPDDTVQRAAVEITKAERLRDAMRDRALARSRRAIDSDDGNVRIGAHEFRVCPVIWPVS